MSRISIFESTIFSTKQLRWQISLPFFFPLPKVTLFLIGLFSVLIIHSLVLDFLTHRRTKNFPPGSRTFFGFLWKFRHFFLVTGEIKFLPGANFYKTKCGKVFGMSNGFLRRAVIISDVNVLKEAFNNPSALGRPPQEFMQMHQDGKNRGVVVTSGESWKEIRRFTVNQLKGLGVGQRSLETTIVDQAEELVSVMRTKMNQPFSSKHFFNIPAFNVLWHLISSKTFNMGDSQAQKLVHSIEKACEGWAQSILMGAFPKAATWLLNLIEKNPFPKYSQQSLEFTSNFVQSRRRLSSSHFDSDSRGSGSGQYNDFTEAFIQKIQSTKDVNSQFYGQLGYENLCETIRDLFLGGTETTGTTMSWALLYLALHPDKQEKLQKEIDTVLQGRAPTLQDKSMMKYTEAVICETLRRSTNLPMGLPHETTEDTRIGKFTVPKHTAIIANAYAIHHSEDYWTDPYSFCPERFLSADESTLLRHEAFIPFSVGKRMCLGAALAKDVLFLFITYIFREFTVTWNPAEPKPEMWSKLGLTLNPPNHTLIITQRQTGTGSASASACA